MLAYAFERRRAQDVAHNARKFAWVERRGSRDFSAARHTDIVRALWPRARSRAACARVDAGLAAGESPLHASCGDGASSRLGEGTQQVAQARHMEC